MPVSALFHELLWSSSCLIPFHVCSDVLQDGRTRPAQLISMVGGRAIVFLSIKDWFPSRCIFKHNQNALHCLRTIAIMEPVPIRYFFNQFSFNSFNSNSIQPTNSLFLYSTYLKDGSFNCTCNPGWTGQFCNINIDGRDKRDSIFDAPIITVWANRSRKLEDCVSNPCINGTCIDGLNAYNCSCFPGYTGLRCDSNIDGKLLELLIGTLRPGWTELELAFQIALAKIAARTAIVLTK